MNRRTLLYLASLTACQALPTDTTDTTDTTGTQDTAATEPLCPTPPPPAAVEAVILEGSYQKVTGIYALPDTLLGSGGLLGMVKVKDEGSSQPSRIQVFTSADGLSWAAARGCAIEQGEEGSWSGEGMGTPSMRQREGAVEVWYRADGEGRVQSVGHTRSEDGCGWPIPDAPALAPSEDWASYAVVGPHVVERDDGQLWMYYRGSDYENQSDSPLGLAVSEDGLTWSTHPENPIVPIPASGWDSSLLADPHVWRSEGRWLMLYSGHDRETTPEMSANEVGLGKAIGLAASWDGVSWTRCGEAPLLAGGVKSDNPFVWVEGADTVVYYRITDLEDGSGGWIERVRWADWPSWDDEASQAGR